MYLSFSFLFPSIFIFNFYQDKVPQFQSQLTEAFLRYAGGTDSRGAPCGDSGETAHRGARAAAISGSSEASGARADTGPGSGAPLTIPGISAAPDRRSCWRHLCAQLRTRPSLPRSLSRSALGPRHRPLRPRLRSWAWWSRAGTRLRPRL